MKVERIQLRGFLSHTNTDWQLDDARLVTLVGANGAGKSSLLDGLGYALFDDARGKTDDLVQLGATDMSASVEFTYAGNRYRVTRGRTTKSGGRSYLEMAIAAGDGWRPLTGPSMAETQQAIVELLRVDADTFGSAVLLMQGQVNAFADAKPSARKAVLSTVLGLDVYPKAEQCARDQARVLDAQTAVTRERLASLDRSLAVRAQLEEDATDTAETVAHHEAELVRLDTRRREIEARLLEVAAELAAGAAAEADVARIEETRKELLSRFRRVEERRTALDTAMQTLRRQIDASEGTETVAAALPELQDRVIALESVEVQDRELERAINERRRSIDQETAAHDRMVALETQRYESARADVDRLTAIVHALKPIPCPKCGEPVYPDRAARVAELDAASAVFRKLEKDRTGAPPSLAIAAGQLLRQEERRAALAFDPLTLANARAALVMAQRASAAAAVIAQHRTRLAEAEAELPSIEAELEEIRTAGKKAVAELGLAQEKVAGLAGFRAEREQLVGEQRSIDVDRRLVATAHSDAKSDAARLRESLEELDRRAVERGHVAAAVESADVELARLRRLVVAFGASGIPARIVESVLPELSAYAQELLGELRPGMTLSIRAQRAKKDGKGVIDALDLIVQDAAGERPLALFSGGERMSVSLALAVGLSRLVARRAGTALRTLVIDEPDGLDTDARAAFGHALRVLAHRGELERVVLVSHHEDLAEVGDATYRVTKNGHGSVVELVA